MEIRKYRNLERPAGCTGSLMECPPPSAEDSGGVEFGLVVGVGWRLRTHDTEPGQRRISGSVSVPCILAALAISTTALDQQHRRPAQSSIKYQPGRIHFIGECNQHITGHKPFQLWLCGTLQVISTPTHPLQYHHLIYASQVMSPSLPFRSCQTSKWPPRKLMAVLKMKSLTMEIMNSKG